MNIEGIQLKPCFSQNFWIGILEHKLTAAAAARQRHPGKRVRVPSSSWEPRRSSSACQLADCRCACCPSPQLKFLSHVAGYGGSPGLNLEFNRQVLWVSKFLQVYFSSLLLLSPPLLSSVSEGWIWIEAKENFSSNLSLISRIEVEIYWVWWISGGTAACWLFFFFCGWRKLVFCNRIG